MRDICRKFATQLFALFALCDVENNYYRADYFFAVDYRICKNAVNSVVHFHGQFTVSARKCGIYRSLKPLALIYCKNIFMLFNIFNTEYLLCAAVKRKYAVLKVDYYKTLRHIFGYHFKFLLTAFKLSKLRLNLRILTADFIEQQRQLRAEITVVWVVQIYVVEFF